MTSIDGKALKNITKTMLEELPVKTLKAMETLPDAMQSLF